MSPNSNTLPSSQHLQRKRKYLSDEGGDFSDDDSGSSPKSSSDLGEHDRRHHHNMLERRRRDHIKDHFSSLKNAIPLLEGEKSSRALILKRAVDYIQVLQSQLKEAKLEIDDYKRRNNENNFRQNSITTAVFNGLLPQQQQPHQQQQQSQQPHSLIHSIPSVSTAFMNLPSTSVIQQQQQQPTLFPSIVSECLQPLSASSPLTVVTPTNYTSTLPLQLPQSLQHHQQHHQQQQQQASDSTKNALLTQLLQLIQTPLPPPPPPSTTISTTLPHISLSSTDFNNNQQLFAFHERQLSSAVQL